MRRSAPYIRTGLAVLALAPAAAWAQHDNVLSAGGFTGLSVTPTAPLMRWGTVGLTYGNELVGGPVGGRYGTAGNNFVAGFGLLPNLEVSGRVATSTLRTNCFNENCGIRDLSFNFKAGAPLDVDGLWHAAVGATDLGGQANFFRSYYGVLTYSPDPFDVSLGYARGRREANRTSTPLNGVFASAAYRPVSWAQAHIEHIDGRSFAGARLFAPAGWLPDGWSAHVGANVRLQGDARSARSWWDVGLTVPLYRVPTERSANAPIASAPSASAPMASAPNAALPEAPSPPVKFKEYSAAGLEPSPPLVAQLRPAPLANAPASSTPGAPPDTATPAPPPPSDEQLQVLADTLRAKGFEDIAVGRLPDGSIAVRVDNATYNHNSVDGLGVALGVIARQLAASSAGYRLVLTQRQIALVGVTGQADCLSQWIAMGPAQCTAGQLYTPGNTSLDELFADVRWLVDGAAPSWATTRLILQPVLQSTLATEYGVFDASTGLRATVQQPLWKGAYAEVSHVAPVHDTANFKDQGVFAPNRIVSVTDRVLLHQIVRVPLDRWLGQDGTQASTWGTHAVTAHVAAGGFDANYRGAYGELRWEPGEGRHRFGVEGGRFERTSDYDRNLPLESRTLLGNYRYAYTPTRTYFEVTAGRFLYNDNGVKFGIKQWFDDVAVSLYLRRTKFDFERSARSMAGIEVSIPLTPRKDMTPTNHIQVTGTARWSYAVETVIREGSNPLSTNQGVLPRGGALDRTFNSDRAGLAYFEDSMPRIRSAARQ